MILLLNVTYIYQNLSFSFDLLANFPYILLIRPMYPLNLFSELKTRITSNTGQYITHINSTNKGHFINQRNAPGNLSFWLPKNAQFSQQLRLMMELFIFDKFTIFEKLFDQMKVNSIHKFGFRIMFISERESINRKGLNKKSISSQSFLAPKAVEHLFFWDKGSIRLLRSKDQVR